MTFEHTVKSAILGLVAGDALGVPVEFQSREELEQAPVTGMWAYGTHHQPAGTWSDDSSMALCLLERRLSSRHTETFRAWMCI